MEKRDIHQREHKLGKATDRFMNDVSISDDEKKRVERFIDEISIGKNSKKKVGKNRLISYLQQLKLLCHYFKKDLKKITEKEATQFYKDLESNKIKKINGGPYKSSSKNEIVKTLKRYEGWLLMGDPEKYRKLFSWIKEYREEVKTPTISREEAERLAELSTTRDACIIMFLFDSGARIEEAMNVCKEDLTKPENKDYFIVHLKGTKTKNANRTISIPIATKYVEAWLSEHPEKAKDDFLLFPMEYPALKKMLKRRGLKINKNLYPHALRHSSATYYANKLKNTIKLDVRYGWVIGSDMSRRYVDRNGINEEETADIIEKGDYNTLSKSNTELKEKVALLENDVSKNDEEMDDIREGIKKLGKTFKLLIDKIKLQDEQLLILRNEN